MAKYLRKAYKRRKQEVRGFLGVVFGALLQVSIVGTDTMLTWSRKQWALSIGVALLPGLVGWIKGGDDNIPDEEMYERLQAVKQKRETQTDLPQQTEPK